MTTAREIINVTTSDGRTLCLETGGDPNGQPVLVHHGTPGARTLPDAWIDMALEGGVRLLCPDRAGYGGSTAKPGRTVGDVADDVRAVAAALGYDRLAVWGISGGGPHALACAALLPDLVCAVASLAALAPSDSPGLDYFEGMGQENVDDMQLQRGDPAAAKAKLAEARDQMLQTTVDEVTSGFETLISGADRDALNEGGMAQYLHDSMVLGLSPGIDGWWDDSVALDADWAFTLSSITLPVQLWHGRQDYFVPYGHGVWLASRIPGVEAHLLEDEGHVTLLTHLPEIHAWLLEHF
jgi:pimeloyl-ACP methyl ester carboxylesterase